MARRKLERDDADAIWIICRDRDAGHLCDGESQHLVHPGVRRRMHASLGLWIPAGRVALWSCRGDLVGSSRPPLVPCQAVNYR
jgi:hypothetical protein